MLGDHPVTVTVFERVIDTVERFGPTDIPVSESHFALRRRLGFASLWRPRFGRADGSPRFKEVVYPSPKHWLHHLEIDDPAAVDSEVAAWLRKAYDRAG